MKEASPTLSFCESVYAGPLSRWHLRKLTEKGKKLGGGVDTPSLCGHVKPPNGWDLEVTITKFHLEKNTCTKCLEIFKTEQKNDG
jgi:hypothetical protein